MSTPTYKRPADDIQDVRFYTADDPYFYTIDNRPLQDLDSNQDTILAVAESARRASLINALLEAARNSGLYGEISSAKTLGLELTEPSEDVVALSPGVIFQPLAINGLYTNTIVKAASLPSQLILDTPPPNLIAHDKYYLVQARYIDGGTGSQSMFEDLDNVYLASTLLHGKVEVGVLSGAEASTGTAVVPSATEGWLPLYSVKRSYGNPAATIARHGSAPSTALIPENRLQMEKPFDTAFFVSGIQPADTLAFKLVFARTVTFAGNFAGSKSHSTGAATGTAVYNVKKNGSVVGTLTFSAGQTSGVFASTGGTAVTFVSDDVLEVVTPAVSDATLAGVSITLAGYRP